MALGSVNVGRPMDPADYVKSSRIGAANGVASLDENGMVPKEQIPTSAKDLGLDKVDNTSDIDKPVSTKQAEAIAEAKAAGTNAQNNLNQHTGNKENPHAVTKTQVGLGNVDNTSDMNKPVSTAQAEAIDAAKKAGTDAQNNLKEHVMAKNPHNITLEDLGFDPTSMDITPESIGAEPAGTAESKVGAHDTNASAHNDIRTLISNLTTRLNSLADSDDTTLDQLSEIVAYIKSNKDLIDAITTAKVSVTDIVNDLITNDSEKPLSAAQGVVLKQLIDGLTVDSALSETSEKPVQNKVVQAAIKQVSDDVTNHVQDIEHGGTNATTAEKARANLGAIAIRKGEGCLVGGEWYLKENGKYEYANENVTDIPDGECVVIVGPVPDESVTKAWIEHGVRCVGQAFEALYFEADTEPSGDIDFNYVVFV